MKLTIITIGEPKLVFVKDGFEKYLKRLKFFYKVEVIHLKDEIKDNKLLDVIDNKFCVVLDERGEQLTSEELANFLYNKSVQGINNICFLIGGPDGHSDTIRKRADYLWSFSKMTFPHDLAMLILTESLYRAGTINANHPYHRK